MGANAQAAGKTVEKTAEKAADKASDKAANKPAAGDQAPKKAAAGYTFADIEAAYAANKKEFKREYGDVSQDRLPDRGHDLAGGGASGIARLLGGHLRSQPAHDHQRLRLRHGLASALPIG
ncbi:MAG: hypothetical protein MZW92_49980 [Comamonadaceae bacterium]|nr:hypothetical protein [Comamonadaceae bacterium]